MHYHKLTYHETFSPLKVVCNDLSVSGNSNPKDHHAALMEMSTESGYYRREELRNQPKKEHTPRELSSYEKYGPVSIIGEKYASDFTEWSASFGGTEGAKKFAKGMTAVGATASMFGIPGGAVIEGFGLGYSSYLDFYEGNENAEYNIIVRGLIFGVGIGMGRSIDKQGLTKE